MIDVYREESGPLMSTGPGLARMPIVGELVEHFDGEPWVCVGVSPYRGATQIRLRRAEDSEHDTMIIDAGALETMRMGFAELVAFYDDWFGPNGEAFGA